MQNKNIFYALGVILFIVFFYFLFLSSPSDFPLGAVVKIQEGSSLRSVSLQLKQENIIKSRIIFESFVIIFGGEKHIISNHYYFENRLPVYQIARRISKGETRIPNVKITIPEGFSNAQIASVISPKLVNFNEDKFLLSAKDLEGYLFPDTYFFLIINTEAEVLKSMRANFNKKMISLKPTILSSGKSELEIITMASLIEGEAKGESDRGFISGILWKRFSMNMPLQVDVAPETYRTRGLPKSPIGNPGLEAIKAAISPQSSPYLYYLHDKSGNIHYAKTFDEHRANVLKYLK